MSDIRDNIKAMTTTILSKTGYRPNRMIVGARVYEAMVVTGDEAEYDWNHPVRLTRFTAAKTWEPCLVCGGHTRSRHHGRPIHLICDETPATTETHGLGVFNVPMGYLID